MADISETAKLSANDGGNTVSGDTTNTGDLSDPGEKYANDQTLSTTAANITLGDISWSEVTALWLKNKSATVGENITILKSAVEFVVLLPGQADLYHPKADGTTWQAKSATGTPKLGVVATGARA
jgi:hypothetical protein